MPDIFVKHRFEGGWATDFGPVASVSPEGGVVSIPFLVDAEGLIYELDGGIHKTPGVTKENSSALESGADVMGFYDVHLQGTAGTPAHHRVIHVGTTIKKDDGDGTFTDLFTGLEAGKVPNYAMLEDLVVMCSDSSTDVPKSWDGTTAQSLAGSPPNFSMVVEHKNYLFAAGNVALPSRLYYCVALTPADWTNAGSGSIDISPSDGDRIMALFSHKDRLFVFKGPNKGSIHVITGTSNSDWARQTFATGTGAAGPNVVFPFMNDVGFISFDGTVRSLSATEQFGDFRESALSLPIHRWIADNVNFDKLNAAWAVNDESLGMVFITLPIQASNTNNVVLGLDYRFSPARWCIPYPDLALACLAEGIDDGESNRRRVYSGDYAGFVRAHNNTSRSIDGDTAINFKLTAPFMDYGSISTTKGLTGGSIGFQPHNSGNITYNWTRDDQAAQSKTISQGGTAVLGTVSSNNFTLGTSALGGSRFLDKFFENEEGGSFRSIQHQFTNSVNYEDVEIHNFGARLDPEAESMENE